MLMYTGGNAAAFGTGLVHPDDHVVMDDLELNLMRSHNAWPAILARRLMMTDHVNQASPYASNEAIIRDMMSWTSVNWIQKKRDPASLFVVLSFAPVTTWEVFYDNRYSTITLGAPGSPWEPAEKQLLINRLSVVSGNELLLMWQKFAALVAQAQSYLEYYHIPYVMVYDWESPIRAIRERYTTNSTDFWQKISSQSRWINHTRFMGIYENDSGMKGYLAKNGIRKPRHLNLRGYPYADGHIKWADHLYNWINTNQMWQLT